MNPFRSLRDYEEFIYTLPQQFPSIASSTLVVFRRGAKMGVVVGELLFNGGCRLVVKERFQQRDQAVILMRYGYEVWRGDEKLYWYDPQPHPNNPELASTHPHHKHIPPDIKHNRIPAPALSFTEPNLPFLIREIEESCLSRLD